MCGCGHQLRDHVADDWDDHGKPINPRCLGEGCDCDWSGLPRDPRG